jgi:hypothetical protein
MLEHSRKNFYKLNETSQTLLIKQCHPPNVKRIPVLSSLYNAASSSSSRSGEYDCRMATNSPNTNTHTTFTAINTTMQNKICPKELSKIIYAFLWRSITYMKVNMMMKNNRLESEKPCLRASRTEMRFGVAFSSRVLLAAREYCLAFFHDRMMRFRKVNG